MIIKISFIISSLLLLAITPTDQEKYEEFMSYGFERFNVSDYERAYWDFYAAALLDVTQDQQLRALYHRNVSDSCRKFVKLAENFYETNNYTKARYYYNKVVFFNEKDTLCIQKSQLCEEKIQNDQSISTESMIFVKAGTFTMGNKNGRNCENFEHNVFISGLFVDIYEVTNQQYVNFLNEKKVSLQNASKFIDLDDPDCEIYYRDNFFFVNTGKNRYPVVEVNWFGANAYAKFYGKRLPTEAEWEYIASQVDLGQDVVEGVYGVVGSSAPNKLGVYDLYGNVREWCDDYYWNNFYQTSPQNNPRTISDSDKKVVRGASYDAVKWLYTRDCELPSETSANLGFRCVKDVD